MTLPFFTGLLMLACIAVTLFGATAALARRYPVLSSQVAPHALWLEGLRGIAVMLVVMSHAPLVIRNLRLNPTAFVLGNDFLTLLTYLGSVGIQIFFCILGCQFARKLMRTHDIDWVLFFFRRVRRLMPAYVGAVLIAILIIGLFSRFDRHFLSAVFQAMPSMMAFGFQPLPQIGAFETSRLLGVNWMLAFEWRFYLFIPLVYTLSRLGKAPGSVAISVVAVTLMMVEGMGVWMFFALGALSAPLMLIEPTEKQRRAARTAMAMTLVSMMLNWAVVDQNRVLQGLHVLVLFLCIVIARPKLLLDRSLVALGTFSYSLYLLHVMVLFLIFGFCNRYVFDVGALSPFAFTVSVCIAVSVVAALSALSYLLLERRFIDFDSRPEARPIR